MTISITPMEAVRPDFAGIVSNIDLRQPLRPEERAKIEAGMDLAGEIIAGFERRTTMSIDNVLASVAVKDLKAASAWYAKLLGRPASSPMPEVAEWWFPRGGCLQVYQLAERAGHGSFTLAVSDIETETRKLAAMGVDTSQRSSSSRVKTVMVTDPDGNHIALAEAIDPTLAH